MVTAVNIKCSSQYHDRFRSKKKLPQVIECVCVVDILIADWNCILYFVLKTPAIKLTAFCMWSRC